MAVEGEESSKEAQLRTIPDLTDTHPSFNMYKKADLGVSLQALLKQEGQRQTLSSHPDLYNGRFIEVPDVSEEFHRSCPARYRHQNIQCDPDCHR